MTAPTHRVVGGVVERPDETLVPGDECVPLDAELSAFPDRFEELPADERGSDDSDEAAGEMTLAEARAVLDENGVDYENYRTLQQVAGDYDGVLANVPKTELQVELAKKLVEA